MKKIIWWQMMDSILKRKIGNRAHHPTKILEAALRRQRRQRRPTVSLQSNLIRKNLSKTSKQKKVSASKCQKNDRESQRRRKRKSRKLRCPLLYMSHLQNLPTMHSCSKCKRKLRFNTIKKQLPVLLYKEERHGAQVVIMITRHIFNPVIFLQSNKKISRRKSPKIT